MWMTSPYHMLSPRLDVAERHFQLALDRVTQWTGSHRFRFLVTKIFAMQFSQVKGCFSDL